MNPWLKKIKNWQNSHIKFEWNCGKDAEYTLEDKLIQFRASGIRVKLPTFAPALNLVGTQIPILPWIKGTPRKGSKDASKGRYLSVKEAASLQGMDNIHFGTDEFKLSNTRIYEALGNAVNVQIVRLIAEKFLNHE
ncbi:MAG: DNA cytosine methyltransferase [Bacteroidales bacterium]|nr:DNA cytosine methyltransferase [Bacteroidales bacterium]